MSTIGPVVQSLISVSKLRRQNLIFAWLQECYKINVEKVKNVKKKNVIVDINLSISYWFNWYFKWLNFLHGYKNAINQCWKLKK